MVATPVRAIDGEPLPPGHWAVAVSPVQLDDGRKLMWHSPQPVAFNLVEAKVRQRRGVKMRRSMMGSLRARDDGLAPLNGQRAIDCLAMLAAAVWFGFTAVESLANHAIEMLDDDASIELKGNEIPKTEMTRRLGIDDKLKNVIPLMDGAEKIAGTAVWTKYRHLKFLRDELLHVKQRGYDPDPTARTAYDRLMVGEADTCADDARAIVEAAWPLWVPEHVRAELDRD